VTDARASSKQRGRPRRIVNQDELVCLKAAGLYLAGQSPALMLARTYERGLGK